MSTEAEKLLAWISDQGIKAEMLDEEVREALSCEASSINNSGVSAQINTLLRCYGNVGDVKAVVMKVLSENEDQDNGLIQPDSLFCNICNDVVLIAELREHLAGHNPSSENFDAEEVRDCFSETKD